MGRILLKPIHGPGYAGYQTWYYPKKTIQSFLERMKKMHSKNLAGSEEEWMSLASVNNRIPFYPINTGEVFELILNGEIRCQFNGEASKV